jgi:large subunit ribosomal protein L9
MQIILQRDVPNLGLVGEVVSVKAGFARNYLVPEGLALVADPKAVRQWEHAQRLTEHAKRKAATEAQGRASDLNGVDLTFPVRVGEQDKLFGSVTNRDVARALVALGHPIDARRIVMDEPIKALGVYQVPVRLTAGVVAEVKVWVVADRSAPAPEAIVELPPLRDTSAMDAEAADEASDEVIEASDDSDEVIEASEEESTEA